MMTDLFSSLDGASSIIFWFTPLIVLNFLLVQPVLWGTTLYISVKNSIILMWSNTTNARFNILSLLLPFVFTFIMFNNLLGLTPFTYTLTSDLFTMFSLAMLIWLFLLVSGYFYAPMKSLAHLVPSGAPLMLSPFLVIIELISIMIRPITLTVRLIANISAGHIVLSLLANTITSTLHNPTMLLLSICSIGYTLFEFFVCVIQAYIFTLLCSLYGAEHP
uniref:ATP synthase subunit a n=1 Tax=Camaenella platyodon TaxID=2566149 RepID=A0A4D6SXA0_9EUPU|nr:ATP synthase subunit 6 [Camaenella platyodon]